MQNDHMRISVAFRTQISLSKELTICHLIMLLANTYIKQPEKNSRVSVSEIIVSRLSSLRFVVVFNHNVPVAGKIIQS